MINGRGYDNVDYIFYNSSKSVEENELANGPSLLLLRVNNPHIFVKTFESQKVQLNFQYKGNTYNYFKISDPVVKSYYANKYDGSYNC